MADRHRSTPDLPVLVGVGQISNRVDRGADVLEPVDLMVEALRRAEADTGATGVLAGAESIRVLVPALVALRRSRRPRRRTRRAPTRARPC